MNDQELNDHVKRALDAAESETSMAIRAKLAAARTHALESKQTGNARSNQTGTLSGGLVHPNHWGNLNTWLVGGAAFASLTLAVFLTNHVGPAAQVDGTLTELASTTPDSNQISGQESELNDLVLLATMDTTEFEIATNLEFTYWLSEELDYEPSDINPQSAAEHNG